MHPSEAKKMIGDHISLGLSITEISQIYNIPEIVDYIGEDLFTKQPVNLMHLNPWVYPQ